MNEITFSEIKESIQEILNSIRRELHNCQRPANEIIVDNTGMMDILNISKRTAASMRQKRMITYSRIGGLIYYKLSDILEFINNNEVTSVSKSRRILVEQFPGYTGPIVWERFDPGAGIIAEDGAPWIVCGIWTDTMPGIREPNGHRTCRCG